MNMYFTYTLFADISFIKWSRKILQIFLIKPYNGHKMCEEPMCNIWPCLFLFCNIQNCQGNLEFLSWNIIEKSLKFFDARLWEPCLSHQLDWSPFQLLDFVSMNATRQNYNMGRQDGGWHRIAWAFLKVTWTCSSQSSPIVTQLSFHKINSSMCYLHRKYSKLNPWHADFIGGNINRWVSVRET